MEAKQIKPLFDRVLVKIETEQQSSGGIFIPREFGERSQIMVVVSVGDGICDDGQIIEITVKSGDRIIAAKYAGTEVLVGSEKFFILKQCDILAKIIN